jgi:hypothetical protein
MAAIIEASNQAYEARDSAQLEIAAVRAQSDRETQQCEEALVELNRCVQSPSPGPCEDARPMLQQRGGCAGVVSGVFGGGG